MRLRTLSIIFMALACINSSYAGIAQLSSSTAKSSYIYNTDQVLWTKQSQNINVANGWGKILLEDYDAVLKEIGSAKGNFSSSIEYSSSNSVYGHTDIPVYPDTDLITLTSTLAKGEVKHNNAGGTYWHYSVTNATINNAYQLAVQDSYHQNTNAWSPVNKLQCLFPERVMSNHSDVTVTYKIIQKFVETYSNFEIKLIGECTATYSGVATTLELSFPQSVINLQTTTNNAEVETFLNTKIVDGIQNQAPTFNLKVESLPDNVRVFVKKGEEYIELPTNITDPSQMERTDTIKIQFEDLKSGMHTYPLRFTAVIN
ncbi:hypothetical protein K4E79_004348 [Escherichia coli]|nr:hypothetical protein [Escherichia coli]